MCVGLFYTKSEDSDPQLPFLADVNLLSQVGAAWAPVDALMQTTVLTRACAPFLYALAQASRQVGDQPQIESLCIIALSFGKSSLDSAAKY